MQIPKKGDLIKLREDGINDNISYYGLRIWDNWSSNAMQDSGPGLCFNEFALVIEDFHEQGGNGLKVITSSGTIGWLNQNYVEKVQINN